MTDTETDETTDASDVIAKADLELELADEHEQSKAAPAAPLGDQPAFYKWELVDGERLRVPQDEHRDPFLQEHRARREAEAARMAEHATVVEEYLAQTPLERARKYSDRESAAIEAMLPAPKGKVL